MERMMKAHRATATLAILIALMVLPGLVRAVDYVPGVKVGDWMKFGQLSVTWTGTGTEPSYVTEEKKIAWAKMEVISIDGATVTLNTTVHYNNGTEIPQSSTVNVGAQSSSTGSIFLIAANLKSGDPLSSQGTSLTINQTTARTYASASRNVNLLNVTTVSGGQTTTATIYFDQITGFMVETYMRQPDYSNSGAYVEMSLKATETNMWSADLLGSLSNNLIYIIAAIIIIIVVIAAAIVLRRRKPPAPPPPSPAQPT